MYQDIDYQNKDQIAVITINRPEVLNAIRVQTYRDLIAAIHAAEQDDTVSVIVITGAAGKFTAGNDLRDLLPDGDIQGVRDGVGGIFAALAAMKKPLILAQEGVAVGIKRPVKSRSAACLGPMASASKTEEAPSEVTPILAKGRL